MDIEFDELDEIIENEAFLYNKRKIVIKFDNFIETVRLKKKRPVWIFRGQSVLGKSYLAMLIYNGSQLDVYETDISDTLPDIITADVIVLGNRVKFDVTDIEKRIFGEHETILVDFNKK